MDRNFYNPCERCDVFYDNTLSREFWTENKNTAEQLDKIGYKVEWKENPHEAQKHVYIIDNPDWPGDAWYLKSNLA